MGGGGGGGVFHQGAREQDTRGRGSGRPWLCPRGKGRDGSALGGLEQRGHNWFIGAPEEPLKDHLLSALWRARPPAPPTSSPDIGCQGPSFPWPAASRPLPHPSQPASLSQDSQPWPESSWLPAGPCHSGQDGREAALLLLWTPGARWARAAASAWWKEAGQERMPLGQPASPAAQLCR